MMTDEIQTPEVQAEEIVETVPEETPEQVEQVA